MKDLSTIVDDFMEANNCEATIDETAYYFYELGKKDMKEQMMKDAVEGEIGYWNQTGLSIRLDQSLEKIGYDEDIKVKIIIVKQ